MSVNIEVSPEDRAAILSEALPYIQKFRNKTIVIKYGGAAMESEELKRGVVNDVVLLSLAGVRVVVVHGGGPEINGYLERLSIAPKFIDGLRYTDSETMDVVQMVLTGKIGKDLAALVCARGGRAVSLSGIDGAMMRAEQLDARFGLVGRIVSVDPNLINIALDNGYMPIISTVAIAANNQSAFNINADTAASAIAVAMTAEKLMLLTDVVGILKDTKDPGSLIRKMAISDVPPLVKEGVIKGGMIPKIDCCVDAVRRGVSKAHIIDGRQNHSILLELLSKKGVGTMIGREE